MIPWRNLPPVNMIYEALQERSAGDVPVKVEEISDWIYRRFNYRISEAELAKGLLTLEALGRVEVLRSGREVIVKLVK